MSVLTYELYGFHIFTLRSNTDWLDFFCSAIENDFLGVCYDNRLYRDGKLIARQATYQGV